MYQYATVPRALGQSLNQTPDGNLIEHAQQAIAASKQKLIILWASLFSHPQIGVVLQRRPQFAGLSKGKRGHRVLSKDELSV
jgi:hypothetical protein